MPLQQLGLVTPPPTLVAAVRQLVVREGLSRTCSLLGVSRNTVDRLRGGTLPVHRGTYLVVHAALAHIAPAVRTTQKPTP
jgi:hypothetical protein